MREKRMRQLIVRMLQPIGAFAVENFAHDGTPDVCTVAGWIELKVGSWPSRAGSRVRIELRTAQGIWMRRWIRHGGKAWTLSLVDQSSVNAPRLESAWFLHNAEWAHDHLGNVTEEEMKQQALVWWQEKPIAEQLISALLKPAGRSG